MMAGFRSLSGVGVAFRLQGSRLISCKGRALHTAPIVRSKGGPKVLIFARDPFKGGLIILQTVHIWAWHLPSIQSMLTFPSQDTDERDLRERGAYHEIHKREGTSSPATPQQGLAKNMDRVVNKMRPPRPSPRAQNFPASAQRRPEESVCLPWSLCRSCHAKRPSSVLGVDGFPLYDPAKIFWAR
jgi:hypothetical protein